MKFDIDFGDYWGIEHLVRITLKSNLSFEKNQTYYVSETSKKAAVAYIEERLKNDRYKISSVTDLGESISGMCWTKNQKK